MRRPAIALTLATLACDVAGEVDVAPENPAPVSPQPEAPGADVPTDPAAVGAWLHAFGHRAWTAQSPVHATGEHGGARVFFNDALSASMRAGAREHPIGSAAVRELYESDLATLRGFALMIKRGPSGPGGAGWWWYEQFGTAAETPPLVAGTGERGCIGCHDAGVDFVHPPEQG